MGVLIPSPPVEILNNIVNSVRLDRRLDVLHTSNLVSAIVRQIFLGCNLHAKLFGSVWLSPAGGRAQLRKVGAVIRLVANLLELV